MYVLYCLYHTFCLLITIKSLAAQTQTDTPSTPHVGAGSRRRSINHPSPARNTNHVRLFHTTKPNRTAYMYVLTTILLAKRPSGVLPLARAHPKWTPLDINAISRDVFFLYSCLLPRSTDPPNKLTATNAAYAAAAQRRRCTASCGCRASGAPTPSEIESREARISAPVDPLSFVV